MVYKLPALTILEFLNGEIKPKAQAKEDGKQYYIIDTHLHHIANKQLVEQTQAK